MNTLIAQLAEQADIVFGFDKNSDPEIICAPMDIEKFAKLIVQECVDVCDAYGMPDGTSQTAMILSMAIKRKFGVE